MNEAINLGIALGLAWPTLVVLALVALRAAKRASLEHRVATVLAIRRARLADRIIAQGLFDP